MILSFLISANLFSDTNFRVISYNALNFEGTSRLSDFRTVLNNTEPDILICQEIGTASAADSMLAILNDVIGGFARADFIPDGDLNNMLFYRTSIASLSNQDTIGTYPRDISEYVMSINDNPIRFYSCHLKAADGSENEQNRYESVTTLRNHITSLPDGTEFIIVGDMNFYTSSETGYQKFIADEADNSGRSLDLCDQVGSWHNSIAYAAVHTQSSRFEQFGGGAGGGLDDKFDFIFTYYELNNSSGIEYISDSFTTYGNDGAHFNQSVNDGDNTAVPDSVADALHDASDHLPVYADFSSLDSFQTYLILSEYIEGSSYNKAIEIYNGTGAAVDLSIYSLEKDTNGYGVWANTYNYSGTLANDDVFVLANSQADPAILAVADDTDNGVINFNGDDQVRLLKYGVEIDRIGIPGDISFGQDVTYVRKSSVTEPLSGPQDPRTNGEWDEYPSDTFDYLGSHEAVNPILTVTVPNGIEEWEKGTEYDITWTSLDFEGNIKIELYKESSQDYTELVSSTENDSIWAWSIPLEQTVGNDYKIRISDANDGIPNDESDDYFSIIGTQTANDLFISEYIEGSSYNKALEIFNGTGNSVDLSDYEIWKVTNGGSWPELTLSLSGTLSNDSVYIIAHPSANSTILNLADITWSNADWNGDDAVGLAKDINRTMTLIDAIGEEGADPGSGWDVAGTTNATKDHTLVRKAGIIEGNTDWNASAGTDTSNSEWTVYSQDYLDNLGTHQFGEGENLPPVISNIMTDPETPYENDAVSVSADISDSDGTIESASLFWGTDGTTFPNEINMSVTLRDNYTTDSSIPGQAAGTTVYFYIEATDDDEETTTSPTDSYTIPDDYTIYEIQGQSSSSPFDGEIVITSGIVTADFIQGYFLQDGAGAWNGIYVYGYGHGMDVGDEVRIQGEVDEYNGLTEIKNVSSVDTLSTGNELPAPTVLTTSGCNAEDYEGVLVQTTGECDNENPDAPNDWGEWSINDGSGSIRIDDLHYLYEPTLGITYEVTGPLYYSYGNYKIEPRDSTYIIIPDSQPEAPDNIAIEIIASGDSIRISWNNEGYEYKIYSDENPYGSFSTLEATVTDVGEAILEVIDIKKFYQVTAE